MKKQKSNLVLHGGSKSNASNNLAKKKKYREIITGQNGKVQKFAGLESKSETESSDSISSSDNEDLKNIQNFTQTKKKNSQKLIVLKPIQKDSSTKYKSQMHLETNRSLSKTPVIDPTSNRKIDPKP
jgi:hypothetical protein